MAYPPTTLCPRCDYDLAGAVESWKSECPLDGRCPECGLEYRWAELLNPALTVPAWSFEHAHARHIRAWFATARRTLRPASFWRALRMEHPLAVPRIIVFDLHWWFLIFLVVVACHAAFIPSYITSPLGRTGFKELLAGLERWADWIVLDRALPYSYWREADLFSDGAWNPASIYTCLAWAISPLTFFTLRHSLGVRGIRPRHIARITAYAFSLPCFFYILNIIFLGLLTALTNYFQWLSGHFAWPSSRATSLLYYINRFFHIYHLEWLPLILGVPALASFWRHALLHYLRLPHATAVAILLTLMATLFAILILLPTPLGVRFINLTL